MENFLEKMSFILLFIFLLFAAGCGSQQGTLVMQITDAPSDLNIEKALITLSSIEVHTAAVESQDENATNETASGWVTVVQEPKTFDLIQLVDVTALLGETLLPAGKYTQIRLHLDSAVITIDGQEFVLDVPSDSLKLVKSFDIIAGQTTTLTLDFDAQESVVATGNGDYRLKPTVKVLSETETEEKMSGKSPDKT